MSNTVAFEAVGEPAPQGSKRHVGHGIMVESSKKLKPWRDTVTAAAREAHDGAPIVGPVCVGVAFRFRRPQSHYGTGRNAATLKPSAPESPCTRATPDVDKLARGVLDALVAAGVLGDDAQVSRLLASKVYVEPGQWTGASVRVMTEINVKVPDVPGGVAHAGGVA